MREFGVSMWSRLPSRPAGPALASMVKIRLMENFTDFEVSGWPLEKVSPLRRVQL